MTTFTQAERDESTVDEIVATEQLKSKGVRVGNMDDVIGNLHPVLTVNRIAETDPSVLANAIIVFARLAHNNYKTASVGFTSQAAADCYLAAWRKVTYGK